MFQGVYPSKFDKYDLEDWLKNYVSFMCPVKYHCILCPSYYVKLRLFLQPNGGPINFFVLQWDRYFIFGFLSLKKTDSDRISTLESFITQKMGYCTVYVSHLGFLSPVPI